MGIVKVAITLAYSLAADNAPQSSKGGTIVGFISATLLLDVRRFTVMFPNLMTECIYKQAPYAR